jgi:hypothetical protein
MEDFIRKHSEMILKYKKNIFTQKTARVFIEKQIMKTEEESEKELIKCLLPKNGNFPPKIITEREDYIKTFLKELKDLKLKKKEEEEKKELLLNQNQNKKNKSNAEWMPKMKMTNENFPSLANTELLKRKKNFVVLDRHYQNKLEPGIKECFCMSTRHPLVGICLECGRIHCLQEGDKNCINCGAKLINKKEYNSQLAFDLEAKNANNHKDKLLQYQKDFYSKLQIVDDFTDWYEVSNNTWLDEKSREQAKKKDEESVINEIMV